MKRIHYACLAVLVAGSPCNAALFERDWKTPGDKLLTFDDVNGREWLDLSVSRLDQFPEPRLANAIAEIGPGGTFGGFLFAKRADIQVFAISAGVDIATDDFAVNQAVTSGIIDLLGPTVQTSQTTRSIGFIDEIDFPIGMPRQVGADFFVNPFSGLSGRAGLLVSASNDALRSESNGLMLFRIVPEPMAILLVISGLSALIPCFSRLKK